MASAAAAVAPTAGILILARAVQGVAGAGLMPPTLALLRTVFTHDRQRMRAVGIWSASGAGGAALGPAVAGVLLGHFYWGSVLLVNLPVVALIVGLGAWTLPEARSADRHPLDPASVALSITGILGVVYGITELSHSGFGYWPAYPALVIGALLVWVFVRRQSGLAAPLVDLALFADRRFSAAIIAQLIIVFANVGALFFLPIFLRQVDGFSALQSGVALLPESLVGLVTAVSAARLIRARGHRRVMLAGLSVGAAGLIGLGLTLSISYAAMVIPLMMLGFSFGAVVTCRRRSGAHQRQRRPGRGGHRDLRDLLRVGQRPRHRVDRQCGLGAVSDRQSGLGGARAERGPARLHRQPGRFLHPRRSTAGRYHRGGGVGVARAG